MPKRPCLQPGCPVLTTQSRCPAHARPNSYRRGYDNKHTATRANYVAQLQAGVTLTCWRCGQPIADASDMDLGHDDNDRTVTRGPEHRRQCNRGSAGRASHGLPPISPSD